MKREKGREGQKEWEGIWAWGQRKKGQLAWGEYSENKNFKEAFLYFNQGQDLSPRALSLLPKEMRGVKRTQIGGRT